MDTSKRCFRLDFLHHKLSTVLMSDESAVRHLRPVEAARPLTCCAVVTVEVLWEVQAGDLLLEEFDQVLIYRSVPR